MNGIPAGKNKGAHGNQKYLLHPPVRSLRGARIGGCLFACIESAAHGLSAVSITAIRRQRRRPPHGSHAVEGGIAMPTSSAENGNGTRRVVPARFAHAV